ncbi:MAG: NADH-quinone oxidoreductase subunit C [Candidatus Micrarchaeia archaeon]
MKIERRDFLDNIKKNYAEGYKYLVKITAVDYIKTVNLIYILRNFDKNDDIVIEVELNPNDLWIETVTEIYNAADWYERELYEMFGIKIKDRRIKKLLLEKWDGKGYPLRKNFVWNTEYEKV